MEEMSDLSSEEELVSSESDSQSLQNFKLKIPA